MQRNDIGQEPQHDDLPDDKSVPVEDAEHPAPAIEHYPEPDAENIMPIEDRPGTF